MLCSDPADARTNKVPSHSAFHNRVRIVMVEGGPNRHSQAESRNRHEKPGNTLGNELLKVMNLRTALTLCPAVLAISMGATQAQPMARVTISGFGALSNAIVRVAGTVSPSSRTNLGSTLTGKLGLKDTAAFDNKAPWELAVWQHSDSPTPLVAVKVPAADVKKFQAGLNPEGLLATMGKDWVQLGKGSSAIVFKAPDAQTEAEKADLKQWESQSIVAPHRTLELSLTPSEATRAQVLPFLGIARMSMSQKASTAPGVPNPKAIGEMFGLYFDALEGFVKSFQEFKLGIGTTADALVLEESVTAKPDSELAKWLRKPANPVTAEDLSGLAPDAMASGAITLAKDPRLMDVVAKFFRLSLELQNQATNDPVLDDLTNLMAKSLPVRISGSVFMKGQMEFSGTYRFPESDAATVYAQMKPLIAHLVKTQAGEGKMYCPPALTRSTTRSQASRWTGFPSRSTWTARCINSPGRKSRSRRSGGMEKWNVTMR